MKKRTGSINKKKEMAIFLLVNHPEYTIEEVAKTCGVTSKTIRTWRHEPPFVAALARVQEVGIATIEEATKKNLPISFDLVMRSADAEARGMMSGLAVLVEIAENKAEPTMTRLEATKQLRDWTGSVRVFEAQFKAYVESLKVGNGRGFNTSSSSASPVFDDPDLDPNRPTAPQPQPAHDPKRLDVLVSIGQAFDRYARGMDKHGLAEVKPEGATTATMATVSTPAPAGKE